MAFQPIDRGDPETGVKGEDLYVGSGKINDNFTELYDGRLGNSGAQQINGTGTLTVNMTAGAFVAAGTEAMTAYGTGTTIIAAHSSGGQASMRAYSYGASTSQMRTYRAAGTYAAPTDLATNDVVSDWGMWGYVGGAFAELARLRATLTSATPGASNKQTKIALYGARDGSSSIAALWSWEYGLAETYVIFRPATDNSLTNGDATHRWSATYSVQFRPGAGAVIWTSGTGSPEGVVTAPVGSMFTRSDGGAGTTLYIKETGTGNTGWTAK